MIDFALTNLDYPPLASRLEKSGTGISYAEPKAGGRTKPDGTELKWEVTFPQGVERGMVPFWCEDITPRERRVPITEAATTHPCGMLGMKGVKVIVPTESFERLDNAMNAIVEQEEFVGPGLEVGSPREVNGLTKPMIWLEEAEKGQELLLRLLLQTPDHRSKDIIEKIGDGTVYITFA